MKIKRKYISIRLLISVSLSIRRSVCYYALIHIFYTALDLRKTTG